MRVSVDVPDPKPGLDTALAKQFADIQKSLMAMMAAKEQSSEAVYKMLLASMEDQRDELVRALERVVAKLPSASPLTSNALLDSVQGIKTTLAALPEDLRETLDRHRPAPASSSPALAGRPTVTVKMPNGLMSRIDALESALLQGLKRSRSRTFGSNY